MFPEPGKKMGPWATLATLLRYLWPANAWTMRARVVLALGCLVLAKVATVLVPLAYKEAVDALQPSEVGALVVVPVMMIVAYGIARVLSLLFGELRDAIFAKVGQRAIRTLALEVFEHLHSLSLRFHLDRQTGGLSRTIERGTRAMDTLLRFSLFNIIPTFIEILMVFVILWQALSLQIALVTLGTVVVYIFYTMSVTEWRLKFRREMNAQDTRANTKAIDSLLNFETVKYFGNEGHEASRYDDALRQYERASVSSQTSLALLNFGQAAIISTGLTVVMLMTARSIIDDGLSLGTFVMANTYLIQLYQPLNFFGFVYREIKQSLIDIEKMIELLGQQADVADVPDAPALALRQGAVSFERVGFGYDSRRPILKDVSFVLPAGQTIAFVGPSGAGKSTISRLLYRFYDADEGAVKVDGQDVRSVTQASLRRSIGIVPQDTVLFNDSIYYNIAYGRPDATREEIEQAARLARIHEFILSLPDGYDSTVGERGLKLSGGEKQRVAIARTILKDPAILVFDEATSALDTNTEQEIQRNLDEISRGRTTLCIAHRLSTVVDADQILVLDGGEVIERGTHQRLLAADGRYAQMWRQQLESRRHNEKNE